MSLVSIFVYSSIAFLLSLFLFPVLIKLLIQWKVLDSPGRHKIHEKFTPSMGGLPVVIGVFFSLIIALPLAELARLKYFFIATAMMFITGLRDDILVLTPRQKMVGQLLPIIILVVIGDTMLNSLYDLLPHVHFNKHLSWIITIFTVLILTNSYNLIDGLDGLAGAIGLISLTFLGIWFFGVGNDVMALISFSFSSALMAFLIFNWQPSKIFMGDTGALTIGLLLSFLIIQFINLNHALPVGHSYKFNATVSSSIGILIIPIFDTLRVIILRLRKFQSPFHADKNHLHHQFLNLRFTHAKSVIWLSSIHLLFIVLMWVLRNQSDTVILPVIIGLCLVINYVLKYFLGISTSNETKGRITERSN